MGRGSQHRGEDARVGVVIATRDRCASLAVALQRLEALPEKPPIVLVDNASRDATREMVARCHPRVKVIALSHNAGARARTFGVMHLDTPYIALCDDDSWWAPGSLSRAAQLFCEHPTLGLIAARILVGDDGRVDPTCKQMAASPLARDPSLPGPSVLGFIACGAVVRRRAYIEAGGFDARFGVGGEEELLALDMATAGWALCYVDDVVSHHDPPSRADTTRRLRTTTRNELWTTWLRRPAPAALQHTARVLLRAGPDRGGALGVAEALRGLPWALRNRRPLPLHIEQQLRALKR